MKFASTLPAALALLAIGLSSTAPVAVAAPTAQACPAYLDHDFPVSCIPRRR